MRVCLLKDFLHLLCLEMSVNLRGREAGVAEQFFDRPNVSSIVQQMGGKCVPHEVRRKPTPGRQRIKQLFQSRLYGPPGNPEALF